MNLTSPKNWKIVKLSDFLQINPTEKLSKGATAPYLAMEKIDPFTRQVSGFEVKEFKGGQKFKNGDTLMARITPCLENGKTAFVDFLENNQVGFGSTEYLVFREKEDISDSKFIYYFVISPFFRNIAIKSMTGTSGRQRVQTDLLANKQFELPSLDDQREIAAILGSLDDKIELLRRENKTLESIAQALFREWFVEFRFPGYEGVKVVGGVPEGWKAGNIYDLMKIQYGFPFKSEFFNENRNGLPLIRIRDLKDGDPSIYTNEVCGEEYIIKRGDIVAGMDAEFRPCIWKGENGVLNQRVCKFISKDESISNYFIYQVIKPHLEFFERTKGGTTVSHLGKADLDSIELLIPPKNILVSFSDAIDSSHKKLVNNFSEIQTLSRLRDDLLNNIFNV